MTTSKMKTPKTFNTVMFLNFRTPKIIAPITLKFEQIGLTADKMPPKDADIITNSEDPDQTAPLGAV